ncbi:phosphoadenosine phosphosulfate reductase family protein [Streptomyces sp. SR-10]|uniref:phosphoadenosine phosphosulfate reductase domain-containing protein n=1 Tax=Streptomyces sp. SR-10 TaxID=3416442 RepID=UPI003CED63CF
MTTHQHVVMWSGGITSWATARHVVAEHGTTNVTLLFADTLIEDEDLYQFNEQAAAQLGLPITRVADGRDPWQVFEDKRWLGNTRIAQCSHALKQEPCRRWLVDNTDPASTTLYVGIDWSEEERMPGIVKGWAPWTVDAPLTRPPIRHKQQLLAEARAAGLPTPRLYRLGFAHNNCGGACVKGGQAQWARLLDVFPDRYARAEAAEVKMRDLLGKDVSILRDRTGGDTKPLTLAALRQRIEEQPDQLDLFDEGGCGCFTDAPAA